MYSCTSMRASRRVLHPVRYTSSIFSVLKKLSATAVVAVSTPTHARRDAMLGEPLPIRVAHVLRPATRDPYAERGVSLSRFSIRFISWSLKPRSSCIVPSTHPGFPATLGMAHPFSDSCGITPARSASDVSQVQSRCGAQLELCQEAT
jgi:hypothetical protein